jgi:hypothetical protein
MGHRHQRGGGRAAGRRRHVAVIDLKADSAAPPRRRETGAQALGLS